MSRVLVVHPNLSVIGGRGKLALGIIETLLELNYDVHVLTLSSKNSILKYHTYSNIPILKIMNKIKIINPHLNKLERKLLYDIKLPQMLTEYHLIPNVMEKTLEKIRKHYDLIINTDGQKLYLIGDINYIHFPIVASFSEKHLFENHIGRPKSILKKAYYSFIKFLVLKNFYKAKKDSIALANSKFTAKYVYKYYRISPIVVYPFIANINDFLKISKISNRQNYVLSVGRISPEKNYYIIPQIAKYSKKAKKFIIVGSTYSASYKIIYDILRNATMLGVRDKIVFVPNADHKTLQLLLSRSKVFLHTMRYEHFGIAVVESMASGLIPVVHKSGGPWIDIIDKGKYGFGYEDIEEAAEIIDLLLDSYDQKSIFHIIMRARTFNKNNFRNKIADIIEKL